MFSVPEMLTCIACSKQLNNGSLHQQEGEDSVATPRTKQTIKALTAQVMRFYLCSQKFQGNGFVAGNFVQFGGEFSLLESLLIEHFEDIYSLSFRFL